MCLVRFKKKDYGTMRYIESIIAWQKFNVNREYSDAN